MGLLFQGRLLNSDGEHPYGPERLRQLQEAVQVILAMWTQEEATYAGNYYQIRGAINQPKGVQQPHIPLLIGGSGEQVTLKLVAQYGDAVIYRAILRCWSTSSRCSNSIARPLDETTRAFIVPPSRSVSLVRH